MSSLMIKNLPLFEELDREAACAVRGGSLRPEDPGVAPGGCMPPPWDVPMVPGIPEIPQIPEIPGLPEMPGSWPQPGGPY